MSVTFDSNFFPDGSIPSLDNDLNRLFGLGEIMFFSDLPVLQTPLNMPTDCAPDTKAIDFDCFSPDASQNSSHSDGSSEPARKHHHVEQVADASSFTRKENESNVGAQESPRTTANSAKQSCNCIDLALRLLEALAIETSIVNARTVN